MSNTKPKGIGNFLLSNSGKTITLALILIFIGSYGDDPSYNPKVQLYLNLIGVIGVLLLILGIVTFFLKRKRKT